jgi:cell division protein FtsZ
MAGEFMAMGDGESVEIREGSAREHWKAVRDAIDDQVLRACLPIDPKAISPGEGTLYVSVDSEFKKEYCLRKLDKLEEAVQRILGPLEVIIGEPPLIEQAKEAEPQQRGTSARIAVLGVGDGGVNAVARMREERLAGVRLVAVDTDRQVLQASTVMEQLQLGMDVTGGRGTGGDIERARRAATESRWEIVNLLRGTDLVFVTAGLGGGTGSGAAPVIAAAAKELGALTVAVVTKPFSFEGTSRRGAAETGLGELRSSADVVIVVSNDRLLETSAKGMPMTKAFELADGILHQGVRGISDLLTVRGLINLDFSDVRNLLSNAGDAMMGMGRAAGPGRALAAAKAASTNPLLEGDSIRGARRLIMNVTGGDDLTLGEVTLAADHIRRAAATECDLVFGAVVQPDVDRGIQITVIAADFQEEESIAREQKRHVRRERISATENLDVPTFLRREREEEADES